MAANPQILLIASPLEEEHVARIRALAPDRLQVLHDRTLLPTPRFPSDHKGAPVPAHAAAADPLAGHAGARQHPVRPARRRRPALSLAAGLGADHQHRGWPGGRPARPRPHRRPRHHRPRRPCRAAGGMDVHGDPQPPARPRPPQDRAGLPPLGALCRGRPGRPHAGACSAPATSPAAAPASPAPSTCAWSPSPAMPAAPAPHNALFDAVIPAEELHVALGMADHLVMTVPHTPATERMLDAAAFAAIKPGATFVNIGRGQTVDHDALIAALERKQVAFAALDVTDPEPLPPDHRLWSLPNVLISPHSASTVRRENARITADLRPQPDLLARRPARRHDEHPGYAPDVLRTHGPPLSVRRPRRRPRARSRRSTPLGAAPPRSAAGCAARASPGRGRRPGRNSSGTPRSARAPRLPRSARNPGKRQNW